jgi:hypothetical protein
MGNCKHNYDNNLNNFDEMNKFPVNTYRTAIKQKYKIKIVPSLWKELVVIIIITTKETRGLDGFIG